MIQKNLYIIDVCGTLFFEDTTIGLLRFHFSRKGKNRFRQFLMQALTSKASPFGLVFKLLERVLSRHILKHLLIRLVAGELESDFEMSAEKYVRELLLHRKIHHVWSKFESQTMPVQIILASASVEPVIKYLAITMGAEFVASKLEVVEGVLTGRFGDDISGRKEQAIKNKLSINLRLTSFVAISDNLTDKSLLMQATKAVVVLHRDRDRARWWPIDAEFLEVRG